MAEDSRQFDELSELLSAYIDGELGEADCARVEAELFGNPRFRQLHDELRGVQAGLTLLARHTPPPELKAGVLAQIADKRPGEGPLAGSSGDVAKAAAVQLSANASAGWQAWLPVLAVAALVLVAVGIFYRPGARDVAQNLTDEKATAPAAASVRLEATLDKKTDGDAVMFKAKGVEQDEALEGENDRRVMSKAAAAPAAEFSADNFSDSAQVAPQDDRMRNDVGQKLDPFGALPAAQPGAGPLGNVVPADEILPESGELRRMSKSGGFDVNRVEGQAGANTFGGMFGGGAAQQALQSRGGRMNLRSVTRNEYAVQQQVEELLADDAGDELLVISCEVTPQAVQGKSLDKLLSSQQIAIVDVPLTAASAVGGKLATPAKPRANIESAAEREKEVVGRPAPAAPLEADVAGGEEKSVEGWEQVAQTAIAAEPETEEAILVEGTPEQIAALLDELDQRPTEFAQVDVLTPPIDQGIEQQDKRQNAIGDYQYYRARQQRKAPADRAKDESKPQLAEAAPANEPSVAAQAYRFQVSQRGPQQQPASRSAVPLAEKQNGIAAQQAPARDAASKAAEIADGVTPPAPTVQAPAAPTYAGQTRAPVESAAPTRVLLLLRSVPTEPADR